MPMSLKPKVELIPKCADRTFHTVPKIYSTFNHLIFLYFFLKLAKNWRKIKGSYMFSFVNARAKIRYKQYFTRHESLSFLRIPSNISDMKNTKLFKKRQQQHCARTRSEELLK